MSVKWEYGYLYFVSTMSEEQREAGEYGMAAVIVDGDSVRSGAVASKIALLNELGNQGWMVENGSTLGGRLPNWLREAVQTAVRDGQASGAIEHYMRRRRPIPPGAEVGPQQPRQRARQRA
ncbi:hypothetical protein [Dactylosporangium sp. CA-139066]|uniref:hypothetical protein n=1 Tax=Dactylosporangium sp. CA-139066 TaxID=3239930 RepID=UPI003D916DBE